MDALRRQRTILTACLNGYLSKASIDPGSRYCPAHPGACKHARWHSHGNWAARVTILPCALPPPFVLPASLRKAHALSAAPRREHSLFVSIAHACAPRRMQACPVAQSWQLDSQGHDIALRAASALRAPGIAPKSSCSKRRSAPRALAFR